MPVAVTNPRRGYLKLAKESTRGTAVAATVSMPVTSRSLQGKWTRIKPDYNNNSVHVQREVAAGRRVAQGDIGGQVLSDSIGNVLMAIFGQDTLTGAGPYTHTFVPVTATPTYTIEKNAGGLTGANQSEQFSNTIAKKVTFKAPVEKDDGLLEYSSSWIGKAPTLITPTSWTQPTTKVWPAALTTYQYPTLGATVNDLLADFEITFEREANFVKGANATLDISDAVAFGFRVMGYVDLYFVDYTYYTDFAANTERQVSVKIALSASEALEFQISKLYWDDENLTESGEFIKRRFPFTGIYDGTVTGAVKVILTNNQSTGY